MFFTSAGFRCSPPGVLNSCAWISRPSLDLKITGSGVMSCADGNADGMILLNGVEVYFAPYLSSAVLTAVQVGDRITVYGELPMAEPMIVAAIIEAANGTRIEDIGPTDLPHRRVAQSHATSLCSPR